ncbi:MAG: hypothetical protein R6T87_01535, partial [Marinobacter sp.]
MNVALAGPVTDALPGCGRGWRPLDHFPDFTLQGFEELPWVIFTSPDAFQGRFPDRTAVWEATLEGIRRSEDDPRQFLEALKDEIRELIERAPATTTTG